VIGKKKAQSILTSEMLASTMLVITSSSSPVFRVGLHLLNNAMPSKRRARIGVIYATGREKNRKEVAKGPVKYLAAVMMPHTAR
jgi:hypothetical protein